MNSSSQSGFCQLEMPSPLTVVVRAEADGPPLAREPVLAADLSDAVAEAWRDQCLRRGHPERALADVPMRLAPRFSKGTEGSRCDGFILEVELPGGEKRAQQFGLACLRPVADRVTTSLVSRGALSKDLDYYYEVTSNSHPALAPVAKPAAASFTLSVKSLPPVCLRAPFRPLLKKAEVVEPFDEKAFPVFVTRAALAKAEVCSRAGAQVVPPVESGGVLIGALAFCDATNEFFAIITDVLEVNEAEQTTFSLAYSGQSWNRIQAIMKAKQAAHPERAERLLGQCHGHNFLPNDGNQCQECAKRATCGLSSVFVSPDDRAWMRAVFARQPWSLCQIFGLNARNEPVHQLYSLSDGIWQARGYYVLPDFEWPAKGPAKPRLET